MSNKVAIIMGTTRPTRNSPKIARWAQAILNQGSVQYDIIDLGDFNLPFLDEADLPMNGNYQNEHTLKWKQTIDSYDGIVFLFPQYNWGYPAVLKNAIDYLGKEWDGKPVSCITYGHHGGNQAYAAMLLVMQCLNMKSMAVNPSITISHHMFQTNELSDTQKELQAYQSGIELMRTDFENELNQ